MEESSLMSPPASPSVKLVNEALWKKFHAHTTEMVVTKNGRKMFPKLEFRVEGLDAQASYTFLLSFERVDDFRHKFVQGEWRPLGRAEPQPPPQSIRHPDFVAAGHSWMRSTVCFERVKITNNPSKQSASNVYLLSMHKYRPVLSVVKVPAAVDSLINPYGQLVCKVRFPETEFMAVTAYQNQTITQLKITHNPFAKGFREGSSTTASKRPLSESPDSSESTESTSPSCKRVPPQDLPLATLPTAWTLPLPVMAPPYLLQNALFLRHFMNPYQTGFPFKQY